MLQSLFKNSELVLTRTPLTICCVCLTFLLSAPVYTAELSQNAQFDIEPVDVTLMMGKKGPPKGSKGGSGKGGSFKGRGKAVGKPRMKRPGMRSAAKLKSRNQAARSKYSLQKKTAPKYARSNIGKTGAKNLSKRRVQPSKTVGNSFKSKQKGINGAKNRKLGAQRKVPSYLQKKVASNKASSVPRKPRLTNERLGHIWKGHSPSSNAKGKGKFAKNTTKRDMRRMVNKATKYGNSRPNSTTQGRQGGTIYEYKFPKAIGVNGKGQKTNRLRVVVSPNGKVVTAFPYGRNKKKS